MSFELPQVVQAVRGCKALSPRAGQEFGFWSSWPRDGLQPGPEGTVCHPTLQRRRGWQLRGLASGLGGEAGRCIAVVAEEASLAVLLGPSVGLL